MVRPTVMMKIITMANIYGVLALRWLRATCSTDSLCHLPNNPVQEALPHFTDENI